MSEKFVDELKGDPALVQIFGAPKVRSQLQLTEEFGIDSPAPMPGRWVRFWHWFLLGWTWHSLEGKQ